MAQKGADRLERSTGAQHGRRGGMTKEACALGWGIFNAGMSQGERHDPGDRRGFCKRPIGCDRSEEQPVFRSRWWSPVSDVGQDRIANVLWQWQANAPSALAAETHRAGRPVAVVKAHVADIASSETEKST